MFLKTLHADKIQASNGINTAGTSAGHYVYNSRRNTSEFVPYKEEAVVTTPIQGTLLEKEVCKALRTYWKKWGFFYIRNQQGLGSKRGTADYTIVRDGRTIFVEAKATKGKQGPHQIEFQAELEAAGGSYYMVHSLEEFITKWKAG